MMEIARTRGALGKLRRRADIDPAEVDRLQRAFQERPASLRTLKKDRKASVYTGLSLGATPVCLKLYPNIRRGRRGFASLAGLWSAGVPVAQPFFLWERPRGLGSGAIVAMEDLAPRRELDRWLCAKLAEESRPSRLAGASRAAGPAGPTILRAAAALGALLRRLHDDGVYLDDLKTCNIFIDDREPPGFRFVDVDNARRGRPVTARRRIKNLAQLNRSTPLAAGLSVRRAFWAAYALGLAPKDARRIRRAAGYFSAERPIVYVTSSGDRTEAWPRTAWEWPR